MYWPTPRLRAACSAATMLSAAVIPLILSASAILTATGFSPRSALHSRHPGKSLDHRIVGGGVGVTAFGAEAVNRAVDDLRIDLANIRIADAETVGDARAIIFDHRVGLDREHADEVRAPALS